MRTPRPHFEELDWLDYAQDLLSASDRANMDAHLSTCGSCAERLEGIRRLANALPVLEAIVTQPADDRLIAGAARMADRTADSIARARRDFDAWGEDAAEPREVPDLGEAHVVAALETARECFLHDVERGRLLVAWAGQALDLLRSRAALSWPGLEGLVGSYRAYLQYRDGKPALALETLTEARDLLDRSMPLRDLAVAFWSYVRAACLHSLSRFGEGIDEIATAEELYEAFEDRRHLVRARFLRAILTVDGGDPTASLLLFARLVADDDARADPPIYALIYMGFANNLVFVGDLRQAKVAYAKTVALLKRTGQEDHLFRVRVGLADIAHREGRFQDALSINVDLRPEFRRRRLPWDEVRRELWIVRQLLALERAAEARAACEALARRAADLSLHAEAGRALSYLSDARRALSAAEVDAVESDLRRIASGAPTRWSAA